MTEPENQAIARALDVLKAAMQTDHAYAWSWHCHIAMSVYEAGGYPLHANQGAARFMQSVFGIDTSTFDAYQELFRPHQEAPHEP